MGCSHPWIQGETNLAKIIRDGGIRMIVTTKTILLTLLSAFLLFISAIELGLKGTRAKDESQDKLAR
jgi:hypothetical protein